MEKGRADARGSAAVSTRCQSIGFRIVLAPSEEAGQALP